MKNSMLLGNFWLIINFYMPFEYNCIKQKSNIYSVSSQDSDNFMVKGCVLLCIYSSGNGVKGLV